MHKNVQQHIDYYGKTRNINIHEWGSLRQSSGYQWGEGGEGGQDKSRYEQAQTTVHKRSYKGRL